MIGHELVERPFNLKGLGVVGLGTECGVNVVSTMKQHTKGSQYQVCRLRSVLEKPVARGPSEASAGEERALTPTHGYALCCRSELGRPCAGDNDGMTCETFTGSPPSITTHHPYAAPHPVRLQTIDASLHDS